MALRALGILIAVALQTGWMLQPQVPLAVRVFQPGLLALSIADPASALLVLAGLGPIAVAICVATGTAVDGGRLFEQMTLALFTGFLIRWPRADDGTRLRLAGPALILAAIGVASAAAVQPALALAYDPHATVGDHLSALWHAKYYGRSPEWEPLFFAALGVEGAALGAVTERLCRARSTLCAAVLRMSIVGQAGAATSAVMSLFIQATRAPHVWQAFIHLYLTSRTSFETDVNTAGSSCAWRRSASG
jgi:hypothetical protein